MRALLALLMLAVLAISGVAPGCAHPQAAHPAMAHHGHMPEHRHQDAASHADCIGCGTELPDPPRFRATAFSPAVLPPVVRRVAKLVGTTPALPLPPPRAFA